MKSTSRIEANKKQMHDASPDLQYLTTFLNLKFGKLPAHMSLYSDWFEEVTLAQKVDTPASPKAVEFAKQHHLRGSSTLIELQKTLRDELMHLVDPDSLIPIGAPPEHRTWFKRQIIGKYLSNPQGALRNLLRDLNRAAVKSEWRLEPASGKDANLHLRGGSWVLKKTEFLTKDKIYSWLAGVLERDEISKLRCCRTCQKFYISNLDWQRDCSPTCKKTYDRTLAAERRAIRAAEQEGQKAATRKTALRDLLNSVKFLKRLPGGPSKKHFTQTQLLHELTLAPSVQMFMKKCDPEIRRIIDDEMT
jgi:hypothetical protein